MRLPVILQSRLSLITKTSRCSKTVAVTLPRQFVKRHYSGSVTAVRSLPDLEPLNAYSSPSPTKSKTVRSDAAKSTSSRNKKKSKKLTWQSIPLQLPMRDIAFIKETFSNEHNTEMPHIKQPKDRLRYFVSTLGKKPSFQSTKGILMPNLERPIFRVTTTVATDPPITGEGDHVDVEKAKEIASLSAVYQLIGAGILDPQGMVIKKEKEKEPEDSSSQVALSDEEIQSEFGFEMSQRFVDFYCRKFSFPKEDLQSSENRGFAKSTWTTVMLIGGKRLGMARASTKRQSQRNCYIDVAKYLESCDPDLWETFLDAVKTGKDLPSGPKLFVSMSDPLQEEIYSLCSDVKQSTLYQNASSALSTDVVLKPSAADHGPTRTASPQFLDDKSGRLMEWRKRYMDNPRMETMRATRANLPVSTRAAELLQHIEENEVTICMAATGSGKTTQIPQLVLDDWIDKGKGAQCNVLCTQPRRIAAISVAQRVANERGQGLGESVGYQVRFDARFPEKHGSITFCTTGIFLKRMQSVLIGTSSLQMSLDDVTHIVIDEVHERDVDTDLILVALKRLLADRKAKNKPLKVILMSATIDPTLFQEYFPDDEGRPAQVVDIPGRAFPVQKYFLDDFVPALAQTQGANFVLLQEPVLKFLHSELAPEVFKKLPISHHGRTRISSYPGDTKGNQSETMLELPYPLIALTIVHVLRTSDSGHVLVFLPGWDDILKVQTALLGGTQTFGLNFADGEKWSIHLLHSTVPVVEQQKVFEPPAEGVRRIILATNIAETSVTIPDVVYVVDTGRVKETRFEPERHISSLVSAWVGTSNLNQRVGRAGRHRPGQYFGVLGKKRASELQPYQMVEMKRVDLSNIVMRVKALAFPSMSVEEVLASTIEPPATERVAAAMNDLQMVGALDEEKNLTPLGRLLLQLPVEVQLGRLVIFGSFFKCLDQALTLAAILANRDPFIMPMALKAEATKVKRSWTSRNFPSDALATLKAYNSWWELQGGGQYAAASNFCRTNFLMRSTLLMIKQIKDQLLQSLYDAGVFNIFPGVTFDRKRLVVPPELNLHHDSEPLLAGLIATASQPNFAVKTSERAFRTAQDKFVLLHQSTIIKSSEGGYLTDERQVIAYMEKRQNMSLAGTSPQTFLVNVTCLDPLTYMLFGASEIKDEGSKLKCDDWLPIVGYMRTLGQISQLKTAMELCLLRIYQGINLARKTSSSRPLMVRKYKEEESEDEDDGREQDYSLTPTEIVEFDVFTRDIVRIMNQYSAERIAARGIATRDSPRFFRPPRPPGFTSPSDVAPFFSIRRPPTQMSFNRP